MAKKPLLILSSIILMVFIGFYLVNRGPDAEQQAVHTATLCNTIHRIEANADQATLIEETERYFKKSTPSYALSQPKYYKSYISKKIRQYLALPTTEQTQLRADYEQCFKVLSQP